MTATTTVTSSSAPSGAATTSRPPTPYVLLAGLAFAVAAVNLFAEARWEAVAVGPDVVWFGAWSSYIVVGLVVVRHRPGLPVGRGLIAVGSAVQAAGALETAAVVATHDHAYRAAAWLGWASDPVYVAAAFLVAVWLPLQLPSGRTDTQGVRRLQLVGCLASVLLVAGILIRPGRLDAVALPNPVGMTHPGWVPAALESVGGAGLLVAVVLATARLILLWRRADTAERAVLAALALGALLPLLLLSGYAVLTAVDVALPEVVGQAFVVLTVASPAIGLGVGVLSGGLLDIEMVLRRTLTYVVLTVLVVAAYAGTVLAIAGVTSEKARLTTTLVVTGLAAVALTPLRERAQAAVDRLLYGRRSDPYGVLVALDAAVAHTRTPAEVLPAVTATIARALRLPYVAVASAQGSVVGHGTPGDVARELSLRHHGRLVGTLVLSARSPGERFSALDDQLLSDVADHVGSAVAAVALAEEAQRSRERLVLALEDDRRRIHRDLHDHLGPVLSGITLQLDALHRMSAGNDPATLLASVIRTEVADAVIDVRRLVHGLRPPVLDELGLVEAVQHHAALVSERLPVTVTAADLPGLPAAVEVAAYRIITEALTNTLRHAAASQAAVHLAVAGRRLVLEVIDDGCGIADDVEAGVGLTSMRERVAELGGVLTIGRSHPGTMVRGELPT